MAGRATNIRRGALATVGAVIVVPATAEAIPVEESGAPVRPPTTAPDDAPVLREAPEPPPASSPDLPPRPANPTIAIPPAEPRLEDPGPTELRPLPAPEPPPEPQLRPEPRSLPAPASEPAPPPRSEPEPEVERGPTVAPVPAPAPEVAPTPAPEPQLRDPGPTELRPAPPDAEPPGGPRPNRGAAEPEPDRQPDPEPSPWEQLYDEPETLGGGGDGTQSTSTPPDLTRPDGSEPEPSGLDGSAPLLAGPLDLDASDVDDPVLRDMLCQEGAVGNCDPQRAVDRLARDDAGRTGLIPADADRQSSPWLDTRDEARREADQAEQERLQEAAKVADDGWRGTVGAIGNGVKGLGETAYRLSPVNRRVDPESWEEETEKAGEGFGESLGGMRDSGVSLYRLSPMNRRLDPESYERSMDELGRTAEYARDNPWDFTKQAGQAMINWEDLRDGNYAEWLGGLGPDAILAAATWGSGAAVTGSLRATRVTSVRAPSPDSPDGGTDAGSGAPDSPTTRPARSADPVERMLESLDNLDPAARARIDQSEASRAAIAGMLRDSSSGTRGNTTRDGQFEPSRTRGHVSEVRVLLDLARRADVRTVTPIPSSSGGRSPDFVVELNSGERERVEVRTVTGARRNYQDTGIGRAEAPSTAAVRAAIRSKVGGPVTQFNARLGDVPEGGILSLHLRGPAGPGSDAANEAVTAMSAQLARARVRAVEVNLTDKTVVRYTVDRDGAIARQLVAPR